MGLVARRISRRVAILTMVVTMCAMLVLPPDRALAVPTYVKSAGLVTNNTTAATVSLASNPTTGNLLVLVCSTPGASTFSATGYTLAKSVSGAPSQAIFYKFVTAPATDRTATCTITRQRGLAQLIEYSGISQTNTLDAVNATGSSGSSTTPSAGTVTTSYANTLVVAAMSYATGTGLNSWTNGFTERRDNANNATINAGVGDYTSYRGRSITTSATKNTTTAWQGQIVSFRATLPTNQRTMDIIDATGTSVASPSVTYSQKSFDFACQTTTSTLGTPTQTIRLMNTTTTATWGVSIAASLPTSLWSDGGTQRYDYNDTTSSGCVDGIDTDTYAGRLTIDASVATIQNVGCSLTGINKGAAASFNEGVVNSISLFTSSATTPTGCIWDVTGIGMSQTIPPEQVGGTYSISLTMTIVVM